MGTEPGFNYVLRIAWWHCLNEILKVGLSLFVYSVSELLINVFCITVMYEASKCHTKETEFSRIWQSVEIHNYMQANWWGYKGEEIYITN